MESDKTIAIVMMVIVGIVALVGFLLFVKPGIAGQAYAGPGDFGGYSQYNEPHESQYCVQQYGASGSEYRDCMAAYYQLVRDRSAEGRIRTA